MPGRGLPRVIPVEAGIQSGDSNAITRFPWTPAFAGVTDSFNVVASFSA